MKKIMMALVLMPMMALATSNLYMVIDLSGGPSATSYPVSYLDGVPAGGWMDEYKTTKLVMRRIEPGSFMMFGKYDVTLTKPYYVGVFTVTQKQYELVTGRTPSNYKGDTRPVENVSWNDVRGNSATFDWPTDTRVDSDSFAGRLRQRIGLDFDLPTAAQWEYACRAGTTSLYNNGSNSEEDMKLLGRYEGNQLDGRGGYQEYSIVGSYQPNAWGLYDMHGNLYEWCLDWYWNDSPSNGGVDPTGPTSGYLRVKRGGAWDSTADYCISEAIYGDYPERREFLHHYGFRIAMTIKDEVPTDGLVAYWPFDGNANDTSGKGNNGVVHDATLTTDRFGNVNHAYSFNGQGQYIELDTGGSISDAGEYFNATTVAYDSFSASLWFKTSETKSALGSGWNVWNSGNYVLFPNNGGLNYAGYGIKVGTDGIEVVEHGGSYMPTVLTYDSNIGDGWNHIVVIVSDNGDPQLYLNGSLVATGAGSSRIKRMGMNGIGGGDYGYFTGSIDEVLIYNRALSAAEVKALYDGEGVTPTGNHGLSISYYDAGDWTTLRTFNMDSAAYEDAVSHFATKTPVLVANTFDIGSYLDFGRTDGACRFHGKYADYATHYFWAFMEGSIVLEETGLYEFGFDCDDSCVIYIDGQKVVYSSNDYDSGGFCQEYASVQLSAGVHAITIVYGELRYDHGLTVYMKRPSESSASPLPQSILYDGTVVTPTPTYIVTFDLNGADGDAPSGRSVAHGAAIGELPTPSRTGYTFLGWFTASSGGTQVSASTTITADATYYAQWDRISYTVTFDANGGTGGDAYTYYHGDSLGSMPTPSRTGYTFLGWFTAKSGGAQVSASTTVTANAIYYAQWRINSYTVTFDMNGADGAAPAGRSVAHGDAIGELPAVTRKGYTFLGWFTAANGGTQVSASTMVTANATYYVQWERIMYTIAFDLNGADGAAPAGRQIAHGDAVGDLPTVTRTGYTLLGWFTAANGGAQISESTAVTGNVTYYAQWRINSYTVTFDAQGGAGGGTVARNHGAALGELPVPTRDGFSFDGWYTAANGGSAVSSGTVITDAATFYAHWTEQALYPMPVWLDEDGEEIDWTRYYDGDEEPFAAEAAATFDGYVLDGEEVCGIIQVKAGKANKKTGTSTVSASLTLLGEAKKRSYKGTLSKRGVAVLTCSGRGDLSLCLGTNAMWGEVDGLTVSGARNVFSKSGDPKASALSKWQGTYTLALETVDASGAGSMFAWGYSGLSVTVGAKGKVKVQGTMVDGAKVNVASQLLVGDGRCCIPVAVPLYSKKGGFGFNLWLQDDGAIEVEELSAWNASASKAPFTAWFGENVPVARTATSLPSSLSFMLVGEPDIDGILYYFLPWEVQLSGGTQWTVPAAGNVKYDRAADDYVDIKNSSNPAGLKLTYVSKTGSFKGSFKIFAEDSSGRLKKYTANVTGVMVGSVGYGTATVKGKGGVAVAIR